MVRLDKPYNIIFGKNAKTGLHIATLMVIREETIMNDDSTQSKKLTVSSYPVVAKAYELGGETWMDTELKDCMVIGAEKQDVAVSMLRKLMDFCDEKNVDFPMNAIPALFSMTMVDYGCKILPPKYDDKNTVTDYVVDLVFEESNRGATCIVYSSDSSDFYFFESFANEPPFHPELLTNAEAADDMMGLRDSYVRIVSHDNKEFKSITFTTKNKNYQRFVEKLNGKK